jgi:hypothetical protein
MVVRSSTSRGIERRLYTLAAVATLLVVLAGFARTYYLKLAFGTPPLSGLLHVHGLVMTAWFVLFMVQARLVAGGRTDLHRRLGAVGALLALAVLVLGTTVAIVGARLGHVPPNGPPPLVFLAVPLGDMVVFALLVGAALWFRRRSDIHKRLMLLSCVGLLTAAIARIPLPWLQQGGIVAFFLVTVVLVLACVSWDTVVHRRLHPAFGWGAALIAVSWPLRLAMTQTPPWQSFAQWIAG